LLAARPSRPFALALLTFAALALGSPTAFATPAQYRHAYSLGLEAYKYGLPLVTTGQTFRTQTSVGKPLARGYTPVNRFSRARKLADPLARTVVAPNHDTLYSIAWLSLKRQPMVLHVPQVRNRYFVIPLLDPYTEDFRNLGTVNRTKPGDYVITGPGDGRTPLPAGTHRIKSPYNRVWIIARTLVQGHRDIPHVVAIERHYTLTPLSRYGTGWTPRYPPHPDTTPTHYTMPTGLHYFDRLGALLERFPPPREDAPVLRRLATVGIGPGMAPSHDPGLSADVRRGLADAVDAGPDSVLADIRTAYVDGFAAHNGWLVSKTGRYGTDYVRRASTTAIGLGALTPSEAIYPFAQVDKTGQPLSGAKRYVLHFAADELPPVRAFWSLSLYDTDGFFVPNPIDRYLINDRTDLHRNPDGSVDVYVQNRVPAAPSERQNWLPSPPGPFRLLFRLYAPTPTAIPGILDGTGWDPPSIEPR
jgi:hypothetical protein